MYICMQLELHLQVEEGFLLQIINYEKVWESNARPKSINFTVLAIKLNQLVQWTVLG